MVNINEQYTAKGYTPAAQVPAVFQQGPRRILSITIHHWGVRGQSHMGVVNFFCTGPGNTSAHFVVSDGLIHCIVSPGDAAWHAGNALGNATSIGIELRPEATPGDYATAAELIRWLRSQYGDVPLIPHRNWQATACPGVWDLNRLDALARSGAAPAKPAPVAPKPAPAKPAPAPVVKGSGPGYCIVTKGDTLYGIAKQFGKSVARLQALNPGLTASIKPGQRIYLLNHCFVERGDTLSGIAKQFGTTVPRLLAMNPGLTASIKPGQVIYLE